MALQPSTPKKRRIARWEKGFLASLRETGNVRRACEAVEIHRDTPYKSKREHPDFALAWEEALEESMDLLEIEARRRAHDGLIHYKFDRNGDPLRHPHFCVCGHDITGHHRQRNPDPNAPPLPMPCREPGCSCHDYLGHAYYELEYSDTLLIVLLKAGRPARFAERLNITNEELDAVIQTELAKRGLATVAPPGEGGSDPPTP